MGFRRTQYLKMDRPEACSPSLFGRLFGRLLALGHEGPENLPAILRELLLHGGMGSRALQPLSYFYRLCLASS